MNPGTVFISHSSKQPDFDVTKALTGKLIGAGLDVWWDKNGLEGGDEFTAEIVEAIIRQHYFLFLLSKHSVASAWCRRELARACELGKTVIPLKLDKVSAQNFPLELSGLQHIEFRQGVEAAFPTLSRALGLGLGQTYDPTDDPFARDGRLVQAIAEQLKYGKSFPNTLNLVRMLANIGQRCCETDRARMLFAGMFQRKHYTGSRIDYDKVSLYLVSGWQAP